MATLSMSKVATQTPVQSTPQKPAPEVDSPGTWRHPRLNEISRRRNATTFSEKNVRRIVYNVAFILGLWLSEALARTYLSPQLVAAEVRTYLSWAYFILQSIPVANIGLALLPLFRATDEIQDIPLTPAQRKLLGLPPSSRPATPDVGYLTPPRYSRTPSLAGSVASNRSYASSPLSGKGGSSVTGNASGSPFSPFSPAAAGTGSPSKFANSIGSGNQRRSSFGSPSPRASGTASNLFPDPASPSPSAGKRTSVGLNNKWLYERGRRSSGGAWSPLR